MFTEVEELSEQELEFYSRQIVLSDLGYRGQLKLKGSRVCVMGLGGLGCIVATKLAGMGVGFLRLVDRDVVELSNLQRQHLYSVGFIGYPKVEVAADRLRGLNPNIEIEPMPLSINVDSVEGMVKGMDVVVDGLDNMRARYAINRACVKLKTPYVFGAVLRTYGVVSTIIPGETPCLECFYGGLEDDALPTISVVGVHPSVISIVAGVEVAEVVNILIGRGPRLRGRLLYCDLDYMSFDDMHVHRREECPVCGSKPSSLPHPLGRVLIEETCRRGGRMVFIINPRENLELRVEDLIRLLELRKVRVKVRARLGTTFDYNQKVSLSILKSGVMIVEGADDRGQALKIYEEIIVDGLGFPWTKIE